MHILEPKRRGYRKRIGTHKTCQFCSKNILRDQGIPTLHTTYWHTIACKYPYLDGNLIISPKRHVEDADDLKPEEWSDLQHAFKAGKRALKKLFNASSFNIGLNIGPLSGQSIKHIHWMLVPRPKPPRIGALGIFNDLHIITMDYKELMKKINALKN